MALTQGMKEQIAKDAGVKDAFAKGDKAAARIIATLAELGLTGGVIGAGGKLVYKGIKGARAMAEARKAIAAAKKAQQAKKTKAIPKLDSKKVEAAKKVKSDASAKPKPETGKTTVMPKKGRSVTTTTRTAPKTTRQTKPMKRVQGTDKPSAKKTVKSPPKAPAKKGLTNAQKLAIAGGVGLTGAAAVDRATRKKSEAKADTKDTSRNQYRPSKGAPRKAGTADDAFANRSAAKSKPKAKRKTLTDKQIAAKMLTRKSKPKAAGSTPDKAKDTAPIKRTNISASKNTGFGPKGNIFPSSEADRKRLMALYGGTGSRAAAAAARGTQGNLKKGRKK